MTMSATKKHTQMTEQQRLKKMSKAQIQLAVIKKKQCDARALKIVTQLLEPHVNPNWLLQNLGFINKSHMEDAIEERAIVKLCGYVLCSNQLTVIIRQQYHISTRKNKVYDISKRKNFCSSQCYAAANFLLEQMLESPLWLRENEDTPVFQIMPPNFRSAPCGDEIDVTGNRFSQNVNADNNDNDGKKGAERSAIKMERDAACNASSPEKKDTCNSHLSDNATAEKDAKTEEISVNINSQRPFDCETPPSELHTNLESKNCDSEEFTNPESNYNNNNVKQVDVTLENLEIEIAGQSDNILHLHKHNGDTENKSNVDRSNNETLQPQLGEVSNDGNSISKRIQPQSVETSNNKNNKNEDRLQPQSVEIRSNKNNKNEERLQPQVQIRLNTDRNQIPIEINNSPNDGKMKQSHSDKTRSNTVISSASACCGRKIGEADRIDKSKKYKPKKTDNAEAQNIYLRLAMHVEQNVREWVTKNTRCLLMGDADERSQLLEKLTQYDRYQQLCRKLNKLQVEDEKEDRVDLERNELKPSPHFSTLQEDGKKMELKVRAFYEGRMTITPSENSNTKSESKDDDEPVLPLTDTHTPNALRRRIFLDNLNKILPDLMRALTASADISSLAQYTYNNEKYSLIKILISTFNLSATNIVFKTAEWTLVGLVIIKMMSLIDTRLQSLLRSKQASMYTSMILTTYKLDSNYLDRLIMEVTNNIDATNNKSSDK